MTMSETARRILEERTNRLAEPIASASQGTMLEMIVLPLGGEKICLEIRYALDVLRAPFLAAIPGAPDVVVGVVNWRGTVLPVFDLRPLFGRPIASAPNASVVIFGGDAAEFGIIGDAGIETVSLAPSDIRADGYTREIDRSVIKGISSQGFVVLDGEALLNDKRLFIGPANDASDAGRGGQA
ncbi:MAG TPA: chemotaxis protein CheW [Magnetospirillaceae bacterium]|jgi:purine-binding chemotaxis protein CheW